MLLVLLQKSSQEGVFITREFQAFLLLINLNGQTFLLLINRQNYFTPYQSLLSHPFFVEFSFSKCVLSLD